jgi:acetyl esterase/lipase
MRPLARALALTAVAGGVVAHGLPSGLPALTVTYRTVGSLAIPADVYRPSRPGPHPVVLWIHGGALVFGDRGMLPAEQRERYLAAGFAVVAIDYRLAPETKLDGILEDLDGAHAWLRREGPALGLDAARLAVVGHSAGGYLALMAGVRFQPKPRAIVSFYGYGDIAGPWYSRPDPGYRRDPAVSRDEAERAVGREPLAQGDESRRFAFYRYARQQGRWPQLVAGHDPGREPHAFDGLCPDRNVTPDFPPTLLVHGDRDQDVPYQRSVEMARVLEAKGVGHELLTLPGLGHVFDVEGPGLKDPAVAGAFDRVVAFLGERVSRPIGALVGAHPRLLLDRRRVESLRAALATTHRFLWERYEQDVPRMVAVSKREVPLGDTRYDGDLIAELAFAWLMTGREDLRAVAKAQLLRIATGPDWASDESLIYLVPGHYITGLALGYDWLHAALTPTERATVTERLGREAEAQYGRITRERVWWRNQYFQNHSHSNTAALAFAAAALWGENPHAPEWLGVAERFFAKTFAVQPEDGSSVEGYAYAGYGGEYLLLYALLARDLFGTDETGRPWVRHFPDYLLQGLLPRRTADEWAMTFGDSPRRGWSSTAHHLFTIARLHRDRRAQWMARETLGLREKGLGSHGWMMLLLYDPTLAPADPTSFPTFARFPEIDQVMMRSSWTDPDATLVGFKSGPFMGRTLSRDAVFDYGSGHQDADSGSFQIFSHGAFLAVDPLYTGRERTEDHSTMLFKGHGQLGEQNAFGSMEALRFGHHPEVVHAETTGAWDYVVGDVTRAYHPALGLIRFVRHLLFVKPDVLVVADEVALREAGVVHDYMPETLETAGGLRHASNGYVVGSEGEAFGRFEGDPGSYRIAAVYLDNVPRAGRYSFEVDGRTVHSWTSRNEDVDDHLIAVSDAVALRRGSRVAFRGASMPPGTRLTKMSVFSDSVSSPLSADWLLHLDPKSEVRETPGGLEAAFGGAVLEVHRLLSEGQPLTWGRHKVARPEVEPFTFRETTRVVVRPSFAGNEAFLLTLLRGRSANGHALADVQAIRRNGRLEIRFTDHGHTTAIDWDLGRRAVSVTRPDPPRAVFSPVALGRIDAHAHFFAEERPVLDLLDRLNLTAVNVCVVDRYEPGYETVEPQHRMGRRLAEASRGRLPWIAAFDDGGFGKPGFAAQALAEVDRALAQGARGVKLYKSLGMELRDAQGRFLLPDDPAFEPVFAGLAARGTTVYAHIAEPIAAWEPLDPMSPDYDYYRTRPAWHIHGRPGVPSKPAILAARDRVLARHPQLRMVGCHLGSMEEDVDEVAERLDRHSNFVVDTAARVLHLTLQPREKVRELTGETIDVDGRKVSGLALPEAVVRRIFRENALRWVLGEPR